MTETQKRLRRWFQRHGWHTGCTPTGIGAYLETPIQKGVNYISWPFRKDGTPIPKDERLQWHTEYLATMEVDRFDPSIIGISTYKMEVFTAGPDFESKNKPWPLQPETYLKISHAELRKILELQEICMEEYKIERRKHR